MQEEAAVPEAFPTSFRLWFGNTWPVGQTPCF